MPNQNQTVPNSPRTPQRAVRIPDAIWEAAGQAMKRRNDTRSDVIRDSLEAYLHFNDDEWEALHEIADRLGMSRADLFSIAIKEFIQRYQE